MLQKKLAGYLKRLRFEYDQWRWRSHVGRSTVLFRKWLEKLDRTNPHVLLGAHLHLQGGVRNHLLAIKRYSKLKVALIPEEEELQRFGIQLFYENYELFQNVLPPKSARTVHTHVLPWLIDWADLHKGQDLKWVHTHHLLYYPEAGKGGIEPWQEDLNKAMIKGARNCDVCLCVSRWEQETLKKQYDIDSQYLPNGVDVPKCDSASATRFSKRFKIPSGFVLWVGRNDPVKNPAQFIRLAESLPSLRFVMIAGLTEKQIAAEFDLESPPNLTLIPTLPHQDVLDAVAACQVLVVTSYREGLPTLVLEGMALQKQLVVPNERGCLDATDGDAHARVFNVENLSELAAKTESAMNDESSRLGARDRVLDQFDWRVVASKLDQIYTS
jgi:glycosyltransferase involved in cell wall biosynthesis